MRAFTLQSGFVTQEATKLIRSEVAPLSFKDSLYTGGLKQSDTENYYDEDVEKLFQLWHKDDGIMRRFEFREEVLQVALRLFSGRAGNITEWLSLQMKQRSVGYLHRRFLKECFSSALNNKQKSTDNYTYHRLLKAGGNDELVPTGSDNSNHELELYIQRGTNAMVTNILAQWTNDIRGFGDLLHSLHVIFGRRSDASAVSSNTGVIP